MNMSAAALSKNQRRVLKILAKIGWGRPWDIALFGEWPGSQAEEVVRRTCKQLLEAALVTETKLRGTRQGYAYMMSDRGESVAKQLGATVIGRSHNLSIGPRWHEHVMAIMVAVEMRKHGWDFYFARELAWCRRMSAGDRDAGIVAVSQIQSVSLAQLDKRCDGLLVDLRGTRRPIAVEIEWSEKKSDEIAAQVYSCIRARELELGMIIAYVYPPERQRTLLEARGKNAMAIDHQSRLARNFVTRASSPEELAHIQLMQLHVDHHFHIQHHVLVPLTSLSTTYSQPVGTSKSVGRVERDWEEPTDEFDDEGRLLSRVYRHLPTGQVFLVRRWVRPDPEDEDLRESGWYWEAWLLVKEWADQPARVTFPDGYPVEDRYVPFDKIDEGDWESSIRAGKVWFAREHARRVEASGPRSK